MEIKTLYQNNNYKIVQVNDGQDNDTPPYHVVNLNTGACEQKVDVYPQALVFAEQFNAMLIHDYHKTVVESQFGVNPMESLEHLDAFKRGGNESIN